MSEWQPIETAPRDGTLVDLWTDRGRITGCGWKHHDWRNGKPRFDESWFSVADYEAQGYPKPIPSHWMPIPIGPEQKRGNDQ